MNIAAQTIVGVVGVLKITEAPKPNKALHTERTQAKNNIISGLRANGRAAAAGTIKSAVIKSVPTTLIDKATTIDRASVNIRFKRCGFRPAA